MFPSIRWLLPLITAVALSACGGSGSNNAVSSSSGASTSSSSGSSSSSSSSGTANAANVVAVVVGPGPTASSSYFNIPSTTVKVCLPGTTTCQTIANVLVDTGSYGLRLMASALNGLISSANYQLDGTTNGNFIAECLPFANGYTWGPVASVDLYIGGEKALALPINILDDNSAGSTLEPAPPASCTSSSNDNNLSSPDSLGANGILGVGLLALDCGSYCAQPASAQAASPGFYYSCAATVCTLVSEPTANQVVNPVALFPVDNNGVVLTMEAVGAGGATTASGTLTFGIGTQTNNALGKATVLTTTTDTLVITTVFNGQTLSDSFLDSGSNGLYFNDSSLPNCGSSTVQMQFYCPTTTQMLTATNQGQNGATTPITFSIGDLNTVAHTDFAISDVGGPASTISSFGTSYFDFGMPFYYGRTVFTGMETATQAPFYAY